MVVLKQVALCALFFAWLFGSLFGTPVLLVRRCSLSTAPINASDVVLAFLDGLAVGGVVSLLLPEVSDGIPSAVAPGLRIFATLAVVLACGELLLVTQKVKPRVVFPVSWLVTVPLLTYVSALLMSSACNALDPQGFRLESSALRFGYPLLLAVPQAYVGILVARLRGPESPKRRSWVRVPPGSCPKPATGEE
jgi:hypothetical protein